MKFLEVTLIRQNSGFDFVEKIFEHSQIFELFME